MALDSKPSVKPNLDVPKGVKIERHPSGQPSSANKAGGEVARESYSIANK